MKTHLRKVGARVASLLARWFAFTGLYAMSGTCPCCGQQGCPAGAGIIGLILALGSFLRVPWARKTSCDNANCEQATCNGPAHHAHGECVGPGG